MNYSINIAIGASWLFIGVVYIILAIPLLLGKVKMNHLYGARFKKSFESEDNWYKINKYSARWMIIWAIPVLITGLIVFFVPLNVISATLFGITPLIFIFISLFQSYSYSKKL